MKVEGVMKVEPASIRIKSKPSFIKVTLKQPAMRYEEDGYVSFLQEVGVSINRDRIVLFKDNYIETTKHCYEVKESAEEIRALIDGE